MLGGKDWRLWRVGHRQAAAEEAFHVRAFANLRQILSHPRNLVSEHQNKLIGQSAPRIFTAEQHCDTVCIMTAVHLLHGSDLS